MPFQACPNIAEAVIVATFDGKELANVLHFTKAGGYSAVDIQTLATQVATNLQGVYEPLCGGNVVFQEVRTKGLGTINDFAATDLALAGPGTAGGQPLPANCSLCVTLRTALTGRSARGRFYAFPTSIGKVDPTDGNQFIAGYGNSVDAMLNGLLTHMNGFSWNMVVLSRHTAHALRPAGVGFIVTNCAHRNLTADSQRGRLPKGH